MSYCVSDADHPKAQESPTERPIPMGVAVATLAAIFVIGAALIATYLYRPPLPGPAIRTVVPTPDNPKVAGGRAPVNTEATRANALRALAEAGLPDGAHPDAPGGVLFKAGDAYLKVAEDDRGPRLNFGFFTLADREWEHGYLTQGVRRLTTDGEYARELRLADDQLRRLREIPAPPPARWADADRDRFLALYQAWRTAEEKQKVPAATRLVEVLRSYATERRSADQRLMEQRATAIRAVLDERQLARINPIPRWELPTTTPTTTRESR